MALTSWTNMDFSPIKLLKLLLDVDCMWLWFRWPCVAWTLNPNFIKLFEPPDHETWHNLITCRVIKHTVILFLPQILAKYPVTMDALDVQLTKLVWQYLEEPALTRSFCFLHFSTAYVYALIHTASVKGYLWMPRSNFLTWGPLYNDTFKGMSSMNASELQNKWLSESGGIGLRELLLAFFC